jgi:hypothetical protein
MAAHQGFETATWSHRSHSLSCSLSLRPPVIGVSQRSPRALRSDGCPPGFRTPISRSRISCPTVRRVGKVDAGSIRCLVGGPEHRAAMLSRNLLRSTLLPGGSYGGSFQIGSQDKASPSAMTRYTAQPAILWRKNRDSNPGDLSVRRLSKPVHLTTLPLFRKRSPFGALKSSSKKVRRGPGPRCQPLSPAYLPPCRYLRPLNRFLMQRFTRGGTPGQGSAEVPQSNLQGRPIARQTFIDDVCCPPGGSGGHRALRALLEPLRRGCLQAARIRITHRRASAMLLLVPVAGLEPARLAAGAFETPMSTIPTHWHR